jgi:hypothetical protein
MMTDTPQYGHFVELSFPGGSIGPPQDGHFNNLNDWVDMNAPLSLNLN